MCRRAETPLAPLQPSKQKPYLPLTIAVVACALMLGALYAVVFAPREVAFAPGIAEAPRACLAACADKERSCGASEVLAGESGRGRCASALGQCASACSALPKPAQGELQLLYASKAGLDWPAIETNVARIAAQLSSCKLGPRELTARVEVEESGTVRPRVAIRGDTAMCVETLLRKLEVHRAEAPYDLVLRGVTPELPPPPPAPPPAPTAPNDFLAQLNKLNPDRSAAAIDDAARAMDDYVARLRREPSFTVREPRVMPAEQIQSELLQSRGLVTVVIFYALAGCKPCKESLTALGPTLRAVRDVMRVHVYDIDDESMHEGWLSFAQEHNTTFEPVRIERAVDSGMFYRRDLRKLGLELDGKIPWYGVLEPDGRVAFQGVGRDQEPALIELLTTRAAQLKLEVEKRTKNQ